MRILFAFAGGRGHVDPLVPLASLADARGHAVAFAAPASMVAAVEALGFRGFPIGRGGTTGPPRRIPLREVDVEREEREFREKFARVGARFRAAGLLALFGEWKPDLVVCDETDFGSMIAAESVGLPYASVVVLAAGSFVRPELVAEPLDEVRREHRLPPDPDLAMLSRYLVLSPVPPSFRDPRFPLPATGHSIRPPALDRQHAEAVPPWLDRLRGAPTVYFTLGTVFNLESGDVFTRVLEGLRELPVEVVATVGPQIDPEELRPLPENVHVERYVPQAAVLPLCSAVVSHGGSGTVVGALAHGLPSVLLPMGADQPMNAARCEELGVARVLDAVRATPETVREAVAAVLADAAYRRAAEPLRDETLSLPEPAYAVALLERLTAERGPLIRRVAGA